MAARFEVTPELVAASTFATDGRRLSMQSKFEVHEAGKLSRSSCRFDLVYDCAALVPWHRGRFSGVRICS